jgi:hypothetical protein
MFGQLVFQPHHIPDAIHATYTFSNDWGVSVVSGKTAKSGLYGRIDENTYEIAIIRPNGHLTGDVKGWCTTDEVSAIMWAVSQL